MCLIYSTSSHIFLPYLIQPFGTALAVSNYQYVLNSLMSFELPYITDDLVGIGGTLRATPEHFIVDEVPLYDPSGEGQHLYVNLTKVGLTTKDVQRSLAKVLKLEPNNIGFAGMKDKHARTTQTFSLSMGHVSTADVDEAVKRIEEELPVTVQWAKQHGNKLKAGHLLGNRFRIAISDLAQPAIALLPLAEAILEQIQRTGIPNYFGPQRFGLEGANVERGYEILLGKKRVKDRWLRRFLVSSYQSYLCNLYLSRRVANGDFHHLLLGDIAKKHDTGGIFDVEDLVAEQPRYEAKEISFTAPMYGSKMKPATHEADLLEASILAESGVTINQLRRAKVDGTRRLGRLLIPDITVNTETNETSTEQDSDPLAKNGQLIIEFFLPKGAFATTVLREIMKVDLATVPEVD